MKGNCQWLIVDCQLSIQYVACHTHPAPPHRERDPHRFDYTQPFNLTGWPTVTVRAGVSPDGMPIGIQIAARPWREDVALALAAAVERELGGWKAPNLPS